MTTRICLVPRLEGLGGMVSFQAKFIQGLQARGIRYTFDLSDPANTAILVIGGTRHIWQLIRARRRGVRIVQRLNGMNWLHRVEPTPCRAYLRSEMNNRILALIRRRLAHRIVYQSQFSQDWWSRAQGPISIPSRIAYNGVDLDVYTPQGPELPPLDRFRMLLVEGQLTGAYARGLETAAQLAQRVHAILQHPMELMVVGTVNDAVKTRAEALAPDVQFTWRGVAPGDAIPAIDRAAHVLFSADLNAACPNSVIEALACGLPVVAYDTGALGELVREGAGEVVPYGADYWRLEAPVIPPLAEACVQILRDNSVYRRRARARAVAAFGLDAMVNGYLEALVRA